MQIRGLSDYEHKLVSKGQQSEMSRGSLNKEEYRVRLHHKEIAFIVAQYCSMSAQNAIRTKSAIHTTRNESKHYMSAELVSRGVNASKSYLRNGRDTRKRGNTRLMRGFHDRLVQPKVLQATLHAVFTGVAQLPDHQLCIRI